MPGVDISNLYFLNRYPQSTAGFFTFCVYLPFGIILLLLRVILGLQVLVFGFILPDVPVIRKLLNRLLCASFGITVDTEDLNKKESVQVYISNYITPFDHLVLHFQTGSVTPGKMFFNSLLSTAFGVRSFGTSTTNNSEIKKNISAVIRDTSIPIHFQPELKQTNGNAVLAFNVWPFELCDKVQPVCIEVSRPFLDIKVSTFDGSYWTDAMLYLFSPYTTYKLRFLPIVSRMSMSEDEFSGKVRQVIANGLGVELSEYSAADLLEWEKRTKDAIQREREAMLQRASNRSMASSNVEVQRMARQVKEVLPMVPFTTICTDLMRTWNVDQTISNILEGHISYIPETASASSTSSTLSSSSVQLPSPSLATITSKTTRPDPFCTAAASFGKSAQERMLSFEERKLQLIENARQRYIEKHRLNVVDGS